MFSISPEKYTDAVDGLMSHIRRRQKEIDAEKAEIKKLRDQIDARIKNIEDYQNDIGRCEYAVEVLSGTASIRQKIENTYISA